MVVALFFFSVAPNKLQDLAPPVSGVHYTDYLLTLYQLSPGQSKTDTKPTTDIIIPHSLKQSSTFFKYTD